MKVCPTVNRSAPPAPAALLALAAAALLAAASGPPAPATDAPAAGVPAQAAPAPTSTVEPTLPLRIDLAFESIERGGGRARGRLSIDLLAIDEVRDLEIAVRHDQALSITEEPTLGRERLQLRRGEVRRDRMVIEGREDRDLPLHLEATFLTANGDVLRLGQGITLQKAKLEGEGRLHLGALEYPALVLDGPIP